MIKPEVSELKKLLTPNNCSITRICGCYVDGEKNKKTEMKQAFLSLPEEEMYKYFEIFRKVLSGSMGKNLLTLDFPYKTEEEGGTQEFLLRLRDSKLKDENLLDEFYDKIIEAYEYVGNYLILVIHDVYDVPGKTSDGLTMEDASDVVYEYISVAICPVNLSKPGLSYDAEDNSFHNRIRDWVVNPPEHGFLFPAFHDRSADIHSLLFYSKNSEELKEDFVDTILGCSLPLSAGGQKESFQTIIEETLQESCSIEAVINIHEKLNEIVFEHKENPAPILLDKEEVKAVLANSGVADEKLENFDRYYSASAGETTELNINNIMPAKTFEVKTPDVVVKVNPERTDLVETKTIDGRKYLMIELGNNVQVNGITIHTETISEE